MNTYFSVLPEFWVQIFNFYKQQEMCFFKWRNAVLHSGKIKEKKSPFMDSCCVKTLTHCSLCNRQFAQWFWTFDMLHFTMKKRKCKTCSSKNLSFLQLFHGKKKSYLWYHITRFLLWSFERDVTHHKEVWQLFLSCVLITLNL